MAGSRAGKDRIVLKNVAGSSGSLLWIVDRSTRIRWVPTQHLPQLRALAYLKIAKVNRLEDVRVHPLAFEIILPLDSRIPSTRRHCGFGPYVG